MTPADIQNMQQFVDHALETWRQNDLMLSPHPSMPVEMRDETRAAEDDWIPWKPIPSTVTDADLRELEERLNRRYPNLYKAFLQYKHFYELWSKKITFFRHGIYEWKAELLDRYFTFMDPARLIGQGYVYFADYDDWGVICFDTNQQNPQDGDCPVILIDHDQLHTEPLPMETLYPSFADMLRDLVAQQQNPTQPES